MAEFENRFDEAVRTYERGDYLGAKKQFEEILVVQPYASEVHLNLGNAYFKLNELEQAETSFRKALELDPLEGSAYLNLGNLCYKQDRLEEAVHYWEIFKKLDRMHINIWLNLGIAYDRLNDPEKALENYSGFIARHSDAPETPRIIERFEQAKKVFEHNIQVAEALLKKNQHAQAKAIFEKSLSGYPGNAAIYKTYASLLYRDEAWEKALKHYEKAYEKTPADAAVLINMGVIYERLNQPIWALWAYHEAQSLPSREKNDIAQRFTALLSRYQSRLPDALASAAGLFRQGKWKQAEAQLKKLSALEEYFPDGGREVNQWLETVQSSLDPTQKAIKSYIARAEDAEANGKFDHALNYYNKLLTIQPQGKEAELARQNMARIKSIMFAAIKSYLSQE